MSRPKTPWKPARIVSGGQTGVDRAALDAALDAGIACGGWCPRGRRAEDGPIPARYPLTETATRDYAERTEWNVREADATLILARSPLGGGTALTQALARRYGKPCLVVNPEDPATAASVLAWCGQREVAILNVAGPRESQDPGIGAVALRYLRGLLEHA